MDLVDYSKARFEAIRKEYELFATRLGFDRIAAIPISALNGDNIIEPSANTPWYNGPALLEYLETVEIADSASETPFRMRVQWVNRPNLNFRGFCGTIASGRIRAGDEIVVTSSGQSSRIARIITMDGDLEEAFAGQAITLTLDDEIDISRGDLLATPEARPNHSERYEAKVVWLHEEAMQQNRSYLLKAGATTAPARVEALQHKINVNTLQQEQSSTLELNEVGSCIFNISREISFDAYRENRSCGSFILVDRMSNATVGAGMIESPLESSLQTQGKSRIIDAVDRASLKGQEAKILWFNNAYSKNSINLAVIVERKLHALGMHSHLLDDVQLRRNLNKDLKETAGDEAEELRRLVAIAHICVDAGLIVLVNSRLTLSEKQNLDRIEIVSGDQTDKSLEEQAETVIKSFVY